MQKEGVLIIKGEVNLGSKKQIQYILSFDDEIIAQGKNASELRKGIKNLFKGNSLIEGALNRAVIEKVLFRMGVSLDDSALFFKGELTVFEYVTKTRGHMIGIIKNSNDKTISYIFSIAEKNTSGMNGMKSFLEFRANTYKIASNSNFDKVELGGLAIHNPDVLKLMKNQQFQERIIEIPAKLGGSPGETSILFFKEFKIK